MSDQSLEVMMSADFPRGVTGRTIIDAFQSLVPSTKSVALIRGKRVVNENTFYRLGQRSSRNAADCLRIQAGNEEFIDPERIYVQVWVIYDPPAPVRGMIEPTATEGAIIQSIRGFRDAMKMEINNPSR